MDAARPKRAHYSSFKNASRVSFACLRMPRMSSAARENQRPLTGSVSGLWFSNYSTANPPTLPRRICGSAATAVIDSRSSASCARRVVELAHKASGQGRKPTGDPPQAGDAARPLTARRAGSPSTTRARCQHAGAGRRNPRRLASRTRWSRLLHGEGGAASSLRSPSVARCRAGRREACACRRNHARAWPAQKPTRRSVPLGRGSSNAGRTVCRRQARDEFRSLATSVRYDGKDAREPRGSDTPKGCSAASALWCPGETENQLAVSAR